ncbi:hypothetical protein HJFPF1_01483 [Paramyrothecium foliicola]|nr:hypothetical protein HJFPF1_01483 [Paramyrothecium foliicola]
MHGTPQSNKVTDGRTGFYTWMAPQANAAAARTGEWERSAVTPPKKRQIPFQNGEGCGGGRSSYASYHSQYVHIQKKGTTMRKKPDHTVMLDWAEERDCPHPVLQACNRYPATLFQILQSCLCFVIDFDP